MKKIFSGVLVNKLILLYGFFQRGLCMPVAMSEAFLITIRYIFI